MGLDMYLSRDHNLSTYDMSGGHLEAGVVAKYDAELSKARQIAAILGVSLGQNLGTLTVSVPVAYWRKANHIHKWFVDNIGGGVDECQELHLEREQMKALLDVCVKVQNDHSLAEELLPTGAGFFFGSTEYDEYYFQDLTHTVIALKATIDAAADDPWPTWTYQASW